VSNQPTYDDKRETQKQWNRDPCGAVTAGDVEIGSAEFYRRVEADRYGTYAPWMKEVMGFARHAGKRVLEIGPGLGTDHAQFARAGAEMFALDLTAVHLEHTRRRFDLEGLATRLIRGDVEALPLADASFDLVYSFGVLHHTPDTARAIREIHRVLRPSGLAIVGLYHKHSIFYWIHTMLLRGVLLGGLWRKGYRRLMADIEYRSPGSEAIPLVKVLSRGECRRLFGLFASVEMRTDHVDFTHAFPLLPHSTGAWRRGAERMASRWGWYVTVFARK
jgi:ubiquinone/menaquinone biosynthesis C-methylase UbiE